MNYSVNTNIVFIVKDSLKKVKCMKNERETIIKALALLKKATVSMQKPMSVLLVELYGRDPFLILISCLLSLRARDPVTFEVSKKLFARVRTPEELVKVPVVELEELFYPLGFYRRKAQIVHDVCQELLTRFNGIVPSDEKDLLSIKGVGRKTAALVQGEGFGIPAICVDTHVHRVANRLGWVDTRHPDDTEEALKKLVPREDWISLNHYLVMWGQNVCVPQSPWCSKCILSPICPKKGVIKQR